jgi:predicted amidohydrolase YtcJ
LIGSGRRRAGRAGSCRRRRACDARPSRHKEAPIPATPPDSPADLVLGRGRLFTGDRAGGTPTALVVRGGRIAAVGLDAQARRFIGPRTRVVDLRGRTVLPGFQDAHVHALSSGLERMHCELYDIDSVPAYLDAVAAYAAANPEEPWIRGGGWSLGDFPRGIPHRSLLDRVVPDRPVFLTSRDGHCAWVNSRALELAGITAQTPEPTTGRIERDPDGTPCGTLQEGAKAVVERLLPADDAGASEQAILESQAYLHSLGITAWQEAAVDETQQAAFEAVAGRGDLTARVVGALQWDDGRGVEQIAELVERRAGGRVGRFAPTTVKIFQDGIVENFTAAMTLDYLDAHGRATGNRGLSLVDPAALGRIVTLLDAEGFQVHVHAIGDRAVREALDAVGVAREHNGRSDGRHHLAHLQFVHPDDLPRFARLGVAATAQPYWAVHERQMDELTIPFVQPELVGRQYPWRSLLRHGATLAMGSDWSVSTPDPLAQIEVAVTRVSDESRDRRAPFLPDERLEFVDALAAFTSGSAHVNHLDETGRLRVGLLADLVVLDRDLFDPGAGPVGDARVVATFVDGVPVFEDPALEG